MREDDEKVKKIEKDKLKREKIRERIISVQSHSRCYMKKGKLLLFTPLLTITSLPTLADVVIMFSAI